MLNKRKLKYNFGTECILLKTVYNGEYIYVITKGEIYIWFNFVFSWINYEFSPNDNLQFLAMQRSDGVSDDGGGDDDGGVGTSASTASTSTSTVSFIANTVNQCQCQYHQYLCH